MAMLNRQRIAAIVIVVLGLVTALGFWKTGQRPAPARSTTEGRVEAQSLVDLSPLKTAQQLAQLATSHDERPLAQEALRLADYSVDLALADAIRDARLHPPPLSAEAKLDKARIDKAEKVLEAEQERAKALSEQLAKAPADKQ